MSNYEVNLKLALDGAEKAAQKIKNLRKHTKELDKDINKFNRAVDKRMGKKKGEGSFVYSFNNLSKEVNSARTALNKAAIGTEQFNKAVENVVKVEETYNNELKKRDRALRIQRIAQQKGISLTKAEVELEKQLAKAKDATAKKQRNKRFGQTISSAAIGGAFPLLFGQTGAAAVGGGLGGLAGGAIGGQFGFALSIVGTAIGSAIDKNEKFNKSLAALNVQFSTTSGGAQILAADVDRLAKRLGVTKDEAIAALSAFKEFGSSSVAKSLVSIFGSNSGAFDTLAATNRQAALAKQIFDTRKEIGNQVAKQLLQQNLINDSSVIELALAEAKAKAANDEAIAKAKVVTFQDRILAGAASDGFNFVDPSIFGEERAAKIQKEFEKGRNKRIKDFKQSLEEIREMLGLVNEAQGQFGQSGTLAFSAINDKVKDLQDEMKRLQDPIFQAISLSDTMASSFEESFKGVIKGTMSVADAFRNMLNRMADHFLDFAAKMLANQFQQGILKLIAGSLGGGFSITGGATNTSLTTAQQVAQDTAKYGNTFPKGAFANGGFAKGGNSYIVGEKGPELFTPGVSGMVTPNHALGGTTNVVVNVDASGSNVEGDQQSANEFGEQLAAAVQAVIINEKRVGGLLG